MTPARPSRRTALALALGSGVAAVASGCALNNPFDDTPTPAADAVRDLSPDVALAVTAGAAIRAAQERIRATVAAYPGTASRWDGLIAMHDAHLTALVEAIPDRVDLDPAVAVEVPSGNRTGALALVSRDERQLRSTFVALALKAESGPFARLLGSMAASVSQHLAALR